MTLPPRGPSYQQTVAVLVDGLGNDCGIVAAHEHPGPFDEVTNRECDACRAVVHRVSHWNALYDAAEQLQRERDAARDRLDDVKRERNEAQDEMLPLKLRLASEIADRTEARAEVERLRALTCRPCARCHDITGATSGETNVDFHCSTCVREIEAEVERLRQGAEYVERAGHVIQWAQTMASWYKRRHMDGKAMIEVEPQCFMRAVALFRAWAASRPEAIAAAQQWRDEHPELKP